MSKVTMAISAHIVDGGKDQRLPFTGGFMIATGLSMMLWGLIIFLVFVS